MKFLKSLFLLTLAVGNISAKKIKITKCIVKPKTTTTNDVVATPTNVVENIQSTEDGQYTITLGDVSMTVDAAHGGRILSFKLGEDEALNQYDPENPNSYGSTFWTSPQSEWNWPPVEEYDSKPFAAEVLGDTLALIGQKSSFGYSIRKNFTTDAKDGAIVVTYSILNESDEVRKVAPWEISRVPNDGILFFEADAVEEANNMNLIPFEFTHGGAWFTMDEDDDFRKINADGSGWVACSAKGLLFVKKFQDLTPEEPAPAEAEVQVYANMGKTFVEVEEQGAYTTLQPGESLNYTVRWYLAHTDLEPVPSKELLQEVKNLIE
ncbi:hypothetical protein BCR32DRAFT_328527 [Anaeromyces robustus]|jgi:hypothetical protein|uniref:DUF4380 domain-containing protein n=1 Tax=Anaeromyces robustus TaxID=1754192 RepID=A0A1Y1WZH2_9FUNG|nr:hypothetical protein BCR32DRAFT_328527 [Anaeromyces robustus]|eukprot:ORX78494.1 hypothetical protein BCR32DRAFT_328527 [Anaeromyces robustus]